MYRHEKKWKCSIEKKWKNVIEKKEKNLKKQFTLWITLWITPDSLLKSMTYPVDNFEIFLDNKKGRDLS